MPRNGRRWARLAEKLAGKTGACSPDFPSPLVLSHLQALLKRKGETGPNRSTIGRERVSKYRRRRKPLLVFWKLEKKLPLCLQWLALSTWPCALQLALRAGHTPTSPRNCIPPLALGTMPGLPQEAKHVARPKNQSGRPLRV